MRGYIRQSCSVAAVAGVLTLATTLKAANPYRLMLGDKAPRVAVSQWVKGEPVSTLEPGSVYVVEFWATWCPPCKESIPHLTELQKKYAGKATFIGVSIWETSPAEAAPYVQAMGDKMAYRVALDSYDQPAPSEAQKDGQWAHDHGVMSRTWMTDSGWDQVGIPTAFVVNGQGRIAWIGDPMELEEPLSRVVAGTWNLEQHAKEYRAEQEALKTDRDLVRTMEDVREKADAGRAVELAEQYLARDPKKNVDILGFEFECLFLDLKDADRAYACARRALEVAQDPDVTPLPRIAYLMAFEAPGEVRVEADLGLEIARKANELADGKRAGVRQALARFLYLKGDCKQAVVEQSKAIEISLASDKTSLQQRLEEYQRAVEAGGC